MKFKFTVKTIYIIEADNREEALDKYDELLGDATIIVEQVEE